MIVRDAMKKAVVIDKTIKLKDAARVMSKKRIGSLIFIKGNKIKGILTETDILKNVSKLDSEITSVMSKNVISIDEGESLDNAAIAMSKHKIKRLPVTRKNKLVGIITATNLLAYADELNENFLLG